LIVTINKVLLGDWSSSQIEYYDSNKVLNETLANFHSKPIIFLKYLPITGYVASTSEDNTINVWDPITWSSIHTYTNHTNWVNDLDQIDKDTLVSGSNDGTIHIWKISTGETVKKINVSLSVHSVKVLLNGQQIACGLGGFGGINLRIYNYTTGYLVQLLNGHNGHKVCSIEILNEQFMASGSSDSKIVIWDLATFSIKYNLSGHEDGVLYIKRLSSNLMASVGDDYNTGQGTIIIWNWLKGAVVFVFSDHSGPFSHSSLDLYDEETLISVSGDQTVKFWNISNGELMQTINANIAIRAIVTLMKSENN
jgi:WD40 repeat protein